MLREDTSAYVVTDVLVSQVIRVTALDKNEGGVKLNVSAIQGAVGGEIGVEAVAEDESDLLYTGKRQLAFGYKAHEIIYSGDRWDVRRVDASGDNALMGVEDVPLARPVLFRGTQFLGPAARRAGLEH
jgi:hypothetical protein